MERLDVPTSIAAEVSQLIVATDHSRSRELSERAAILCDIDLAVLGSNTGAYKIYASHIRREYGWVSAADYRVGRSKILQSFLDRKEIYRTPDFRDRFEQTARENLTRELAAHSHT